MFVKKYYGFVFILFLLLIGCDSYMLEKSDEPVAKVGNRTLYRSELLEILPETELKIDSISLAQTYIEKWVRNQLLLEKAEENVDSKSLSDVENMMENYRISLIVFKYQQMLIKEKLDTVVTQSQIDDYYAKQSGNFKLDSSVVKARFVQVPKALHDSYKISNWIKSNKEADLISLEDYCYQNARNFSMGDEWMYFGELLTKVSNKVNDRDSFLKWNHYFERTDSLYKYYVSIVDYKLTNDTTPQYFVENKIRDIILNRRKIEFIQQLENNVYRDGVNQKKFIIYTN